MKYSLLEKARKRAPISEAHIRNLFVNDDFKSALWAGNNQIRYYGTICRNAFENTGDSQKSSEAMFARKVILVEGKAKYLFFRIYFHYTGMMRWLKA